MIIKMIKPLRRRSAMLAVLLAGGVLSGCSSTPPTTMSQYLLTPLPNQAEASYQTNMPVVVLAPVTLDSPVSLHI